MSNAPAPDGEGIVVEARPASNTADLFAFIERHAYVFSALVVLVFIAAAARMAYRARQAAQANSDDNKQIVYVEVPTVGTMVQGTTPGVPVGESGTLTMFQDGFGFNRWGWLDPAGTFHPAIPEPNYVSAQVQSTGG